ncbi:MAG: thioredoxin domain-containing protein [Terracidiphilus sp.]|nr:thioredoxin domain-containing protein [Terracidiphilus sp.]
MSKTLNLLLRPMIYALFFVCVCNAQAPQQRQLSADENWRIEVLLRSAMQLEPETGMTIRPIGPSAFPNFDKIGVTLTAPGKTSNEFELLLSHDSNSLAQFKEFKIAPGTQKLVSDGGRPSRGGGPDAPVQIVVFDDLECPFCAQLHAHLFQDIHRRYGDLARVTYRDFPIEGHPWAMHAAIAVGCVHGNNAAYWKSIDDIHAAAAEIGGPDRKLSKAFEQIDAFVLGEAKTAGLLESDVKACIAKADKSAIEESLKEGEALGVGSTPTVFINGAKIFAAVSDEFIFTLIDRALQAKGKIAPAELPPAL